MNKTVDEGSSVTLACNTNDNWKQCFWLRDNPLRDNHGHCTYYWFWAFDDDRKFMNETCSNKLSNVTFQGNAAAFNGTNSIGEKNWMCQITIPSASMDDDSIWTCSLNACAKNKYGCGYSDPDMGLGFVTRDVILTVGTRT